jgi:hypothetical protein
MLFENKAVQNANNTKVFISNLFLKNKLSFLNGGRYKIQRKKSQ